MFDYNKLFTGSSHTKSIVGFEELSRIFGGNINDWSKKNQLEQYSKSLYVFAAVNKIATKTANIDLRLYQIRSRTGDSEELYSHEILDLMSKINPFQTRSEFLKTSMINKKLTGEAFWLKIRNNRGQVVELWNLRPDLMTVVSDPMTYIKHYELDKEAGGKELFVPEDIIHFKDPDPTNAFRGLSPLLASKARIETESSAANYQRDFFKNNARPDALLVTEQQLDTEQRTQMTSAWEERHQGKKNEGKIGILEGGMKYQQVSISQREMDYIESMKFTRDDILVALGVPKGVITTDDVNYANADAAMKMFLSEVIKPEMDQLVEVLNEFLVIPDFGEQFFIDNEDPTPSDREALRADSSAGYGKWLTVNEIRTEYNKPEIEGGDVIAQTSEVQTPLNDPNNELSFRTPEHVKRKAAKMLQGRPMLRKRFEMIEYFKKELKNNPRKKTSKKSVKGKKEQTKEFQSLLQDELIRRSYYDLVNKRIDKRAESFERGVINEFNSQQQRVLDKMDELENEKSIEKMSHSDVNRIMDKDEEIRLFAVFALPFLEEFAQQGGEDASNLTGEEFTMSDQLRSAMEARSSFFASSVVDTTFQSLVRTLTQGINDGEGINDLKSRVQDVYGEIPEHRAALIARTETTNANNQGILDQFRQSEVVRGKEWIATMDDVTRDEHRDLNGDIVEVDAAFENGLQYPQEPNCRCVIGPALYDEE